LLEQLKQALPNAGFYLRSISRNLDLPVRIPRVTHPTRLPKREAGDRDPVNIERLTPSLKFAVYFGFASFFVLRILVIEFSFPEDSATGSVMDNPALGSKFGGWGCD
jgi:hypothetical protein